MSRASKLTLAATSLGAVGILISVHYAQKAEQAVCSLDLVIRLLFIAH